MANKLLKKARRADLARQRRAQSVDPLQAAEAAIEERETAPVRKVAAWTADQLWVRAELPDGTIYEGPAHRMPQPQVTASYRGGEWVGPASKLPAGATITSSAEPMVLTRERRQITLRPASTSERRRLSWLAKYEERGTIYPAQAAAGHHLKAAFYGAQATLVSGFDRDAGGSSGAFPMTRLEACAQDRRALERMIGDMAEKAGSIEANVAVAVCCFDRSAPAAYRQALAEENTRRAERGAPLVSMAFDDRTAIRILCRALDALPDERTVVLAGERSAAA